MGLIKSWKKSSKIKKLQKIIHPHGDNLNDLVSNLRDSIGSGEDLRQRALIDYLALCAEDDGVKSVLDGYGLSAGDLERIYAQLLANGFGWIKGHHTALSSVAYLEPLQYYVEMEKRGENKLDSHDESEDVLGGADSTRGTTEIAIVLPGRLLTVVRPSVVSTLPR